MPTACIGIGDAHGVYSCGDCALEVQKESRNILHRLYVMNSLTLY